MKFTRCIAVLLLALSPLPAGTTARAQGDPQAIAAQKEAMKALASLDGAWRGPGWIIMPSGEKYEMTQTERVGSFLDGSVKVLEGKGYDANGRVGFNAFAVISYDATKKAYTMRSYAMGRAGDFPITPTADGFTWEHPLGGTITMRYTAVVKNGEWNQVGERVVEGQAPVRMFEMNLKRIGDSEWPAAGAIAPK